MKATFHEIFRLSYEGARLAFYAFLLSVPTVGALWTPVQIEDAFQGAIVAWAVWALFGLAVHVTDPGEDEDDEDPTDR